MSSMTLPSSSGVQLTRSLTLELCLCALLTMTSRANAATITVNAGGDLQAALNAAQPGDTILLQAGAVFTGNYRLPAKGGSAFITLRSAAPDASLPPAGTRITPTYRPALASIRSNANGPALRTNGAAGYWRLLFLEFAPSASNSSANLVELGTTGSSQSTLATVPQHLVIDRCYLHGDPAYGQRRGVALNSGDTQVLNSYFADFKGVTQDTQAIAGWNGPGPYLIENNYIEAAGENILFGGSDPNIPNLVPSNIAIRRNSITKQPAWITQTWTVKNLIELKNADTVVVEGNTIEHNWAAGQQGYSILLTPRNQSGTAPWTVVKNITIQNNVIRHVAAVFNISGYDDLATSQQTHDIIIRNNLIYDVSATYHTASQLANGWIAQIGAGPKAITFDHNTIDNDGKNGIHLSRGQSPTGILIYDLAITNNFLRDNRYGAINGDGSTAGSPTLAMYAPNAYVHRNAIGTAVPAAYPSDNDPMTMVEWLASFVSIGSNYTLVSYSPERGAATDGKDVGVDFAELNAALAGAAAPPPPPPLPPPPAPGSTPYSGTPIAVPGPIQAEHYDKGGEGIAYHDTTAGNAGGAFRANGVDIQGTMDTGGGYNIAWVKAGEWLRYTVNVTSAGTYALDVRVASSGAGGTFHIEVNGVDKTGPIVVPNTGAWQTWQTVTKSGIALAAGEQVMRVVMDTNGGGGSVGNFNWIAVR
jgi:hypothetical protein